MLFTRKLITKFIPDFNNISDDKFVHVVNSLGMEVESITKYQPINNVVIGQLVSIKPIEGTHLSLCEVKISETQTNKIVCGAKRLRLDAKVIVALEGAKLPNGLTISKRKIHEIESNGMLCAYSELTNNETYVADEEQDEIVMLDEGVIGSTDWPKLIGLDDTTYDVTIPANRNDENAYLVFCYELANKLGIEFKYDLKHSESVIKGLTYRSNQQPSVCSFLGFIDYNITPLQTSRSDWKLKSTLMNHGIKPINKILDTLALITLLTNCPTHIYDVNKLHGQLSCKLSTSETKFVALNGKTYTLAANDILICDESQPVSIAAVIGSDNTKLTNKTTRVRIEVGNFNYASVRTTATRLNCETDASRKASRPLSTFLNLITIRLIQQYLGVPVNQTIWYYENWNNHKVKLSFKTLSWFIHEKLSRKEAITALKKLGYECFLSLSNRFKVPPWRLDVQNQEDLFEDILKIIDVNKLQPISIVDNLLPLVNNVDYELKKSIQNILINNYFNEVKTYNLVNKSSLEKFNLFNSTDPIKIISNNANRAFFRWNLLDGMLKVYRYNDARKLDLHPIFELQKLFTNKNKWTELTCVSTDKYYIDRITNSCIYTNINYYKSVIKQIASILNTTISFKQINLEPFYNNESIAIVHNGQVVGYIGKIKSKALKDYDLNNKQIYAMTIKLDSLINSYVAPKLQIKSFGLFQRISKDINITLSKANVELVNKKIDQIKKIDNIVDAKIINIFTKGEKTVYTVRYYLTDERQFTTSDLELITKQIEGLSSL